MSNQYSRQAPSPRYRDLIQQYQLLHEQGEPYLRIPADKIFAGGSLPRHAPRIRRLVQQTASRSILDYGSGKGKQYQGGIRDGKDGVEYADMQSYWGVSELRCYDPGYRPFSELPEGTFDGVVCTDVLEHCPEEDIAWIIGELFAFARKFMYANIACYPAMKRLPTGDNAHCTVKPVQWWLDHIERAARAKPEVRYELSFDYFKDRKLEELTVSSA